MGTDYFSRTVVGFVVEDLYEFFGEAVRHRDEVSHMEDRYDTRTGKLSHQEKVIDVYEGDYVVVDGVEFDLCDTPMDPDLLAALDDVLGANTFEVGDTSELWMAIEPNLKRHDDFIDVDQLTFLASEIRRIGDRCRELGFNPGCGGIHSVLDVG